MKKRIKILVDACMGIMLILLFPTAKVSPTLHIFLGYALIPVIVVHLLLNCKWLFSAVKNLLCGKLQPKARYMLMLVVGLMIAFAICCYSGIVIYQSDYYPLSHAYLEAINTSMRFLYFLHGISSVACVILTVFHARVHWKYIKSFTFGKKTV